MKIFYILPFIFISFFLKETNMVIQNDITGAWEAKKGDTTFILVFQDNYFSYTAYDIPKKKFFLTYGGTFSESGDQLHTNIEFDTESEDAVGMHKHFSLVVSGKLLKLSLDNGVAEWTKIDDGNENLAGNWRITGRMNNGLLQQMPKRARKTLKLLSGTRFQWMAINPETKEFFGTGGGTYTFKDGKYIENIEFFFRDSSRVGASLVFEGSVNNNVWTHKGFSSKGDPIQEEWTREK